jgi:hypothetical protein
MASAAAGLSRHLDEGIQTVMADNKLPNITLKDKKTVKHYPLKNRTPCLYYTQYV